MINYEFSERGIVSRSGKRDQLWRIMRLTSFLLLWACLHVSAASISQTVTLKAHKRPLTEVLTTLKKQTGYRIMYNDRFVKPTILVSVDAHDQPLESILDQLLTPQQLTYHIEGKTIAISRRPGKPEQSVSKQRTAIQRQDLVITGKVTDEEGSPLEGVTVNVKGTQAATTTGSDGSYRIAIPGIGNTLVFSIVGFKTVDQVINSQRVVHVTMETTVSDLDEVIVVGYGTQKRTDLTGAVSALDDKDFGRRQVGQSSLLLQGVAPGVTVTQRSGQPGFDGGTIRIRGNGTIGDNNPMVLVDGVEMNMNNIDPETIESISVLKDAASSSIYGSRAANGVILITTKRAKKGQTSMVYNAYYGFDNPTNLPQKVNALDHMVYHDIAYINSGRDAIFAPIIDAYRQDNGRDPDNFPDTDWMDLLLETGHRQNHSLSFNKGYENLTLAASFGYLKQDGIISNSGFDRLNFRLNSDVQISRTLTAKFDVLLTHVNRPEPISGSEDVSDIFFQMYRIPSNQPAKYSNGLYGEGWAGMNPLQWTEDGGVRRLRSPSASMNFQFDYKPLPWLTANLVFSPIYTASHNKVFAKALTTYNADGSVYGNRPLVSTLTETYSRTLNKTLRGTIQLEKDFSGHYVKVLGGYSQEDYNNYSFSGYREGFQLPQYDVLDAGGQGNKNSAGSAREWALSSVFGRVNYSFDNTYLLEFTGRYDGSSRFAKKNRFAFFPSVSVGWRLLEEQFMQPLTGTFRELKLRGSWGKLGNQNIGDSFYPYISAVPLTINYTFGNQIASGARLLSLANEELKWEQATMSNIGLDLTLKSNISVTFDYFNKKTNDILLTLNIPNSLGLNAPYQNAGSVSNKGWELGVKYLGQVGGANYSIVAALSDVVNKIEDLKGISSTALTQNREGYAMNSLYGFFAEGYFQDAADIERHPDQFGVPVLPGDIRYRDLDENGVIDDNDRGIFGNTIPRYTYSLNLNLDYKGFDFGLFLQGVGKVDGYLYSSAIMPFFNGGTIYEAHKDYWTPENRNAEFPRLAFNAANNQKNSDFWMRSAAYLRMKNIQLGYSFRGARLNNVGINSLRLYLTGENLFTFDRFWDGFDVEAPVGTGNFYPQVKSYSIGLNINF